MATIKFDDREIALLLQTLAHRRVQTSNPALRDRLQALEDKVDRGSALAADWWEKA